MNTMNKLLDISGRLEQLESSAEWIARETVHADGSVSQAATLISVLAEDVRERICNLVRDVEESFEIRIQ